MTYQSSEQSVASGRPVELYHFYSEGEGHFRQTSGSEIITFDGYDWTPDYPLKRTEIRLMGTSSKNEVEIVTVRDNPTVTPYIAAPPEYPVYLVIYRGHGVNFITYRNLVLTFVSFRKNKVVVIKAEPKTSNLRRVSKQRISCRLCNLPLYRSRCGVNQEAFKIEGVIDTVDGITLTSTSFTDESSGWLVAGKIIINNRQRMILTHVGDTITLVSQIPGVEVGDSFRAHAGCDHLPATCKNIFSNLDDYWGDIFLPTESLYGSPLAYTSL